MDISQFSKCYTVRRMKEADIADIFTLCCKNHLFYQYCPPFVTEESIADDMKALPPNKELSDKYYLGYYDAEKLIAEECPIGVLYHRYTTYVTSDKLVGEQRTAYKNMDFRFADVK